MVTCRVVHTIEPSMTTEQERYRDTASFD